MSGPEVAGAARTFMGIGVSGSHERRRLKFSVSLCGVVSCKGAASPLIFRVNLSSSSSLSVVVPGGWSRGRQLSDVHRRSGDHRGMRVFSLCGRVRNATRPVSS